MDQFWQKVLSVVVFTLKLFQLSLTHFIHQSVNLQNFIPEADCSILKNLNYDLYMGIENLKG